MKFNLLDEKWLPCLTVEGRIEEVGIRELFARAQNFAELRDPSCLATVGLHRLLIVILHRALDGPKHPDEWGDIWRKRGFYYDRIDSYLCKHRDRFDLFDANTPFFQSMDGKSSKKLDVAYLFLDRCAGTNINHFSHDWEGKHAACPACCARWLVTLPAFCTQGGRGKAPSINDAPPVYTLIQGRTLFETLMLNMPIPAVASLKANGDLPVWEGTTQGTDPIGFMEGFTWQPRQVLLRPERSDGGRCTLCGRESNTLVGKMAFHAGRSRTRERHRPWKDPHVPIVRSSKGFVPLKPPHPLKARWKYPGFWREAFRTSFTEFDAPEEGVPILRQALLMAKDGMLRHDALLGISHVMLHSFKAKLFHTQELHWRVPLSAMADEARRAGWKELLVLVDEQTAVRAMLLFEDAAERIFREHMADPEALPLQRAEARVRDAAERAFEAARPTQGCYSRGGANRARLP